MRVPRTKQNRCDLSGVTQRHARSDRPSERIHSVRVAGVGASSRRQGRHSLELVVGSSTVPSADSIGVPVARVAAPPADSIGLPVAGVAEPWADSTDSIGLPVVGVGGFNVSSAVRFAEMSALRVSTRQGEFGRPTKTARPMRNPHTTITSSATIEIDVAVVQAAVLRVDESSCGYECCR